MADVHRSYAQALFELASEEGNEEQILIALKEFSTILEENSEYLELLDSPSIEKNERIRLAEVAIGDKYPETMVLFFKYMCEKGKVSEFLSCVTEYEILYSQTQKLSKARVITAITLTEFEKEKIINKIEKITNKKILPEYVIDEKILGGVIIETEDKVYDGSLRKKMNDIKKVMKE